MPEHTTQNKIDQIYTNIVETNTSGIRNIIGPFLRRVQRDLNVVFSDPESIAKFEEHLQHCHLAGYAHEKALETITRYVATNNLSLKDALKIASVTRNLRNTTGIITKKTVKKTVQTNQVRYIQNGQHVYEQTAKKKVTWKTYEEKKTGANNQSIPTAETVPAITSDSTDTD